MLVRSAIIQSSKKSYRYWRWQITGIRGGGLDSHVQAAELNFQIAGVDQSWSGATVSNPGGSHPVSEEPWRIYDGNVNTKWLDLNFTTSGITTLIFDFGSNQKRSFSGYRWSTANDSQERDPKTWTISASNNNSNWTTLSNVSNFTSTTNRNTFNNPFLFSY
jgi:hypothetical protein